MSQRYLLYTKDLTNDGNTLLPPYCCGAVLWLNGLTYYSIFLKKGFLLSHHNFSSAKILFYSQNPKKKLKNLHKREIFLIFAEKKDGKGNISLSVISHKSCNNS